MRCPYRTISLGAAILLALACSTHYVEADELIQGHDVYVYDGDTIRVGPHKIRFHGIDAPESSQSCQTRKRDVYACGRQATVTLRRLIAGEPVTCKVKSKDRYGRYIGVCYAGNINLNASMVRMGEAVAYRQYSSDYVRYEDKARHERRGLWSGEFQMPWLYRHARR